MPEFNEFFVSGDEEKISAFAESHDDLARETQRVLTETVNELAMAICVRVNLRFACR